MGARACLAALHMTAASLDGQRGVTVRRGRFVLSADALVVLLILERKTRPLRSTPPCAGVYNVMTRHSQSLSSTFLISCPPSMNRALSTSRGHHPVPLVLFTRSANSHTTVMNRLYRASTSTYPSAPSAATARRSYTAIRSEAPAVRIAEATAGPC